MGSDGFVTLRQAVSQHERLRSRSVTTQVLGLWIRDGLKTRDGHRIRLKADRFANRYFVRLADVDVFLERVAGGTLPRDVARVA
jgi:hypothetical protein